MKKFLILGGILTCILFACILITAERDKKMDKSTYPDIQKNDDALYLKKEDDKAEKKNEEEKNAETDANSESPVETPSSEKSTKEIKQVKEKVSNCFSDVKGTCQWGIYDFDSGAAYINDSESVPSASVIKVFIMEYAFHRVHNVGDLSLTTTFEGTELKTLVKNMITVSDNASTNVLINAFGMDTLNNYFSDQGYTGTRLERKMLDYDAMAAGKDNYTSVNDSLAILKKIYNNQDNEMYKDMLYYLKQQTRRGKIPANIPDGAEVANKTGELDTVENDIGLIFSEETDFAAVFLCSDLSSRSAAVSAISKAARSAYDVLSSTEN